MSKVLIKLLASVTVAVIMSLAAIWGWNHLFGDIRHFAFDLPTIGAVMAISFVFTSSRVG